MHLYISKSDKTNGQFFSLYLARIDTFRTAFCVDIACCLMRTWLQDIQINISYQHFS